MKFDLDKNIEFCKNMMPKAYDFLAFVLALLIGAFAKDFDLQSVMGVCGAIVLYELSYWFLWVIHAFLCAILKYSRDKRKKKEVNNENI